MCSMCAEYIGGSWFCPTCAIKERRIAAGLDFDLMATGLADSGLAEEAGLEATDY
jgi:hypothetical protein